MNNEKEFKRFLKEWQAGQPFTTPSPCRRENWEVKVWLDTKPVNDFLVDYNKNLKDINSLPSKFVIEKLKYIFHHTTPMGLKKLSPHLLKVKNTLLGNPNASFGHGRKILRKPMGNKKAQLWFEEIDTYTDQIRSITMTFVQFEVNNNPTIKHSLLMTDLKINF